MSSDIESIGNSAFIGSKATYIEFLGISEPSCTGNVNFDTNYVKTIYVPINYDSDTFCRIPVNKSLPIPSETSSSEETLETSSEESSTAITSLSIVDTTETSSTETKSIIDNSPRPDKKPKISKGTIKIIAISIPAAVVAIIIICIVVCCLIKKKSKQDMSSTMENNEICDAPLI